MPRGRRISPDNSIQHVLNRGNRRERIFNKPGDYEAFLRLMSEALGRVAMRILAFCLMPNHWHFVLWPESGSSVSAYIGWLSSAHVRHHHEHYGTTGQGHLYQERFKNFLVQNDSHVYTVLRYVEGNAHRAKLVDRAEEWPWSSAGRKSTDRGQALLSEWPISRPQDWIRYVNEGIPSDELAALRNSTCRGTPYGQDHWVRSTTIEYGLESTVRPSNRPPRPHQSVAVRLFE